MKWNWLLVNALNFFLLFGCASSTDIDEETKTASELYAEATDFTNAAFYAQADSTYQELLSTYPTSIYSQQALLNQIYLFLNRREYDKAVSSVDRFASLYPEHSKLDYALYMKGIIYFREDRGLLDKLGKQDPSRRDSKLMKQSYEAFQELLERFPDSEYAADATYRMRYLVNSMAKSEAHVAQFYLRHEAYVAAIARAKNILKYFPDSSATEVALTILLQAYRGLGTTDMAQEVYELIKINFPNNELVASHAE